MKFSLPITGLRERDLAALCLGAAASLLLPDPGWGLLGLLLLPAALSQQNWLLVMFLAGYASGAANGALWLSSRLPVECLGKEVGLAGRIVTLPREQVLRRPGQRRQTQWGSPPPPPPGARGGGGAPPPPLLEPPPQLDPRHQCAP